MSNAVEPENGGTIMTRNPGPSAKSLARAVLQEEAPLSAEEILARCLARERITSRNPLQTVRNALTADPYCGRTADGRYVYLPRFLRGACVRLVMDMLAPEKRLLVTDQDVVELLWVMRSGGESGPAPTLALEGGPTVQPTTPLGRLVYELSPILEMPAPFWSWWTQRRQEGADSLLICCDDAETGRFHAEAIRAANQDAGAVERRNAELLDAAGAILRKSQNRMAQHDLVHRLLAWGVYQGSPAPEPLGVVLFALDTPFVVDRRYVTYRTDLTPALRRLFAHRLAEGRQGRDRAWRVVLDQADDGEPEEQPASLPAPMLPTILRAYRLRVTLAWTRQVWRVLELRDDQTLDDLHLAIQRAFDWDNDHLYAFHLGSRPNDALTAIAGIAPYGGGPFLDDESPVSDEVVLAELELQPGQRFSYLFDFGDQLLHEIEVLSAAPAVGDAYPRVVESHGQAPPQYPNLEEDWDDEEDEE
jgi:hypothetical protein